MTRIIHQTCAIEWLNAIRPMDRTSIVASMPDLSEFPHLTIPEWKAWFTETARLLLEKTSDNDVTIFYQTDIKKNGEWIDKSYLCQKAAELVGSRLLWHKMICRVPPGITTFGKPSYTHILCFSKAHQLDLKNSGPDIIPVMGSKTWERGMGIEASLMISKFLKKETQSTTIIQPFCGEGSFLAVAEGHGFAVIGIERSHKRAFQAEILSVNLEEKTFNKKSH